MKSPFLCQNGKLNNIMPLFKGCFSEEYMKIPELISHIWLYHSYKLANSWIMNKDFLLHQIYWKWLIITTVCKICLKSTRMIFIRNLNQKKKNPIKIGTWNKNSHLEGGHLWPDHISAMAREIITYPFSVGRLQFSRVVNLCYFMAFI